MNEMDTNLVPRAFSLREKGKALETRLEQERAYSGILQRHSGHAC